MRSGERAGPASAVTDSEARKVVSTGKRDGQPSKPSSQNHQAVRGELLGDDSASAAGVTIRSGTPILTLCRELLTAGIDPDAALDIYRGAIVALRVHSIGTAAGLQINSKATGFVARPAVRTASSVRKSWSGGTSPSPDPREPLSAGGAS